MIKEEKSTKEIIVYHKHCDDCGIEIKNSMACSNAKCEMCGKDLCNNCVAHEEYNGGDCRTVYCSKCWYFGIEYLEKIKILENEIEILNNEWQIKCINERLLVTNKETIFKKIK
jgi:hypothetical protein